MRDGFAYLRDTPVPSVTEAKKMLQKDLMEIKKNQVSAARGAPTSTTCTILARDKAPPMLVVASR